MSRALGPRAPFGGGNAAGAWVVLGCCWGMVALGGLVWAAARMASVLWGGTTEPFGITFVSDVLHGHTSRAWPHTLTPAVTAVAVLLAGAAIGAVIVVWRIAGARIPRPADPVAALAATPASSR